MSRPPQAVLQRLRRAAGFGLVVLALLVVSAPAMAEPAQSGSVEKSKGILDKLESGVLGLSEGGPGPAAEAATPARVDKRMPEPPPAFVSDSDTYQKYLDSLQAYFDSSVKGLAHRQRVFEWQLFSAKLIFVIVLLLVGSGVYFAAVQFHVELKSRMKNPAAESDMKTELSAGADGVKVSSGVLGVIILTLSLAFFYLYLVYVYPIEEIL